VGLQQTVEKLSVPPQTGPGRGNDTLKLLMFSVHARLLEAGKLLFQQAGKA